MNVTRESNVKHTEISLEKKHPPPFVSVTQKFLSSAESKQIKCPTCGNTLDFSMGVKWEGPDSFTCCGCNRLLSMRLIHRALGDLGAD